MELFTQRFFRVARIKALERMGLDKATNQYSVPSLLDY